MVSLRDAEKDPIALSGNKRVSAGETTRAVWTQPAFWLLVVYFKLPAIAGWVTKNWLPTFLADTFNLKPGPAGLSATGYIQLASLGGVFLGGVVADWWMRKTSRGRIYTSALGVLLLLPALLGLAYAASLGVPTMPMILFGTACGYLHSTTLP